MSNQVDPLLFWLEQEPVNSNADIYLPADTPNDYALSKYNYQLDKKRHMKRFRTIERLRAHEFEMIANRRKTQLTDDTQMPARPFAKLENISGDEFLTGNVDEIIEILKMTKNRHHLSVQENDSIKSDIHFEERDYNHARSLQIKNLALVEEKEREFARLKNVIFNETPDHTSSSTSSSSSSSTIAVSDSPPLPPRMSSRDPRSFLPEFRKAH